MGRFGSVALAAVAVVGIGSVASAADMPTKALVRVDPVFSWTGFYLGATAGQAWGTNHFTVDNPAGPMITSADIGAKKFVGGVTAGYNWQIKNIVLGIETDFSSGLSGSIPRFTIGQGFICGDGPCEFSVKYFGTARARAGLALDRALIYGTGGLAYGRVHGAVVGSAPFNDATSTATGWTAGGGIEYSFAPNWSAKGEYLHIDLGNPKAGQTGLLTPFGATARFDVVRFGLNYRLFN